MQAFRRPTLRALGLSPQKSAQFNQRPFSSLINSLALRKPSDIDPKIAADLNTVVATVQQYDPAATLPGLLLPTFDARLGYFSIRSFWVETGLTRLSPLPDFGATEGTGERKEDERIRRWRRGIDSVYEAAQSKGSIDVDDSTLSLIHYTLQNHSLSRDYFDAILEARCKDIDVKQYETTQDLINHASLSCGSLIKLVLECSNVPSASVADADSEISRAAEEIGIAHGLTNALRQSIPVLSSTGKVIVPADLCIKYGVKSPRYLLSALGMGDEKCKMAMQSAVEDLANIARCNLSKARARRDRVLTEPGGEAAVAAFLPGLISETFLDRLEAKHYHLSDRKLRMVGISEHAKCALKTVSASMQKAY